MKKTIWFLVILLTAMFLMKHFCVYRATFAQADEPIITMTHQQEVWMHILEYCESSGREKIKIMDSNNRYSYGVLMFQMETFLREGKNYGILDQSLTPKQAEETKMIYSYDLQEKIAYQMLLKGGEHNWYTCHKKLGNFPKE